jgi:hypothetical protein
MLLLTLTTTALLAMHPASHAVPMPAAAPCVAGTTTHLDNARRAASAGDLTTARREYRIATVLERDEGCLPETATHELAGLLLAQSRRADATAVLHELAAEAARAGDVNTEARARVAAAWLYVDAGDHAGAKADVRRLHELARDTRLDSRTRRLLRTSLG